MFARNPVFRTGIAALAVLAGTSLGAGDTLTWDGEVNREWSAIRFPITPPFIETNWNGLILPGADDVVRFSGASPGDVYVGDLLGTIKSVDGNRFAGPSSYRLVKSSYFGGELRLGGSGIQVEDSALHEIHADLTLTEDTQVTLSSGGLLKLSGKLSGQGAYALTMNGNSSMILSNLDEGSSLDRLYPRTGRVSIEGGHLDLGYIFIGSQNSSQVSSLGISGAPALSVDFLELAPGSSNNFIQVIGEGTRITTELRGTDEYADFRLGVDDGAELLLTGRRVELDEADEISVSGGSLFIEQLEVYGGRESHPIRLGDPIGGEALIIGGQRDSFITADIVDHLYSQGSVRKVGPGRLELLGDNAFTGSLVIEEGIVEVTGNAVFRRGDPIEVARHGTLEAHVDVLRAIDGPGNVEVLGDVLLGDFTTTDGFRIGRMDVNGRDVVLLDADEAVITDGVSTLDGGRLRTTAGLRVDPNATLRGHGTVGGGMVNLGIVEGAGPGLVLNGEVSGDGDFLGSLAFTGLFEPGNSPGTVIFGSPEFLYVLRMALGGLGEGESDRLRILGDAWLDGVLEIELLEGFQPGLGDRFVLLEAPGSGSLNGSFDLLDLPELPGDLIWEAALDSRSFSVQVVPEPATTGILGLGALALVMRRRNRG